MKNDVEQQGRAQRKARALRHQDRAREWVRWFRKEEQAVSNSKVEPPQQNHPLSLLHEPLHWRAQRDPIAKCFLCSPFYRRACRWALLGEIKTQRT